MDVSLTALTDRLVSDYGLSSTEAKLAVALATGTSLIDHADSVGINVGTMRVYLRQARLKMGVSQTRDLVSRVNALAEKSAADTASLG